MDELEKEVEGSLEFVDELDSFWRGNKRGTPMEDQQAEDEEDPDFLLEEADERDQVDLDALLMLEIVRGIGMDSFEGCL